MDGFLVLFTYFCDTDNTRDHISDFFLIFLVGFIFEVTSQITYLSDFVDGIFIFNQIK